MLRIFESLGFEVEMTQDIEDDFHNFEALTSRSIIRRATCKIRFTSEGGCCWRTHTSNARFA